MAATSFSDMPTLASSTQNPSPPFHRRRKSWARRIERCCCTTFSYFPLVFVYSLTTWAVFVEVSISFLGQYGWFAYVRAGAGILLYTLANVSYTIAVFTSPGSPLDRTRNRNGNVGRKKGRGYQGLPTYEDEGHDDASTQRDAMTSVTAKSTGQQRYCKKCQTVKPDRTHHCSTCGRCVLKMDHHCPWLATCVGLRNYKPFLLFLVYTSAFCFLCFASSATWVWTEIMDANSMSEGIRVVNTVMLAVLGGIIGLVLSGFTGWHIYLAMTGQTTIESLEKTRYLSPLRKSMQPQFGAGRHYLGQEAGDASAGGNPSDDQPLGERLKEIHANALPGILRPEEGDAPLDASRNSSPAPPGAATSSSPAQQSLHRSYASMEAHRERERYAQYLDEQDSEKLPNAFNLGWKRNLLHVLGHQPLYWFLPVCNTTGDGWVWEVSPKWNTAREQIGRDREQRDRENAAWDPQPRFEPRQHPPAWRWNPGEGFVDRAGRHTPPSHTTLVNAGKQSPKRNMNGSTSVQMQPLDRRKGGFEDDASSFNEGDRQDRASVRPGETANWNDLPDDLLLSSSGRDRSGSRSRTKGD